MTRPPQISRSFPVLTLLLAIPLVVALAYVSYDRYLKDDDDGWKTYRNERFKYELRYPADWKVVFGSESQPGDGFTGQYVVLSPTTPINQGVWPAPNVLASVNFQGDPCGAGGFDGKPIEVSSVKGSETVCFTGLNRQSSCTPTPQCVEVPLATSRWFPRDGLKYFVMVSNNTTDSSFNGTPLPANSNAAKTHETLRKILESFRFVD